MAIGTAPMQGVGTSACPTTDHGCILIPSGSLESCYNSRQTIASYHPDTLESLMDIYEGTGRDGSANDTGMETENGEKDGGAIERLKSKHEFHWKAEETDQLQKWRGETLGFPLKEFDFEGLPSKRLSLNTAFFYCMLI